MTKYLKLFTSNYERDGYENSDNYLEPYVSIVNGGGVDNVYYNLVPSIILTMRDSSKIKLYNQTSLSSIDILGMYSNIDLDNVTNIYLSDKVTNISTCSMMNNLKTINIPNSVTYIRPLAFSGCGNLRSLSIPSSIENIDSSTFQLCFSLSSVTLTDSITSIDESAFSYDDNIHELKIIGKKNISNLLPHELTDNLTNLYVDTSLVETYKTFRNSIGKTFEVKPLN